MNFDALPSTFRPCVSRLKSPGRDSKSTKQPWFDRWQINNRSSNQIGRIKCRRSIRLRVPGEMGKSHFFVLMGFFFFFSSDRYGPSFRRTITPRHQACILIVLCRTWASCSFCLRSASCSARYVSMNSWLLRYCNKHTPPVSSFNASFCRYFTRFRCLSRKQVCVLYEIHGALRDRVSS